MCKLFYLPLSIKVARLVFLKGYLSSGGGQGGGSPGEQGAGGVRETGKERAGGGISTMAGSGREIKKVKVFFVTVHFQSKKRTQQRFLTSI